MCIGQVRVMSGVDVRIAGGIQMLCVCVFVVCVCVFVVAGVWGGWGVGCGVGGSWWGGLRGRSFLALQEATPVLWRTLTYIYFHIYRYI